jgi:hypothetical protein
MLETLIKGVGTAFPTLEEDLIRSLNAQHYERHRRNAKQA